MSDNFGVPSSDFETVDNYSPSSDYGAPTGRSKKTLMIVLIVAVVLCCCCVVGGGILYALWTYGDQLIEQLGIQVWTMLGI